jgi:hypothetical protein
LASGAVVLKYFTQGFPFYHSALEPWVHYVPLKKDLSDLLETLRWLKANDDRARQIGDAGRAFAHRHLSPPAVREYIRSYLVARADVRPRLHGLKISSLLNLIIQLVVLGLPTAAEAHRAHLLDPAP